MKKRITLMMLALMMVLSLLAGCSKKDATKTAAAVGNWEAVSIEMEGQTIDVKQYAELLGEEADQVKIILVFTEDGKATLDAAGESTEGTWKAKDDKYEVTFDGQAEEVAIVDGQIVIEESGIKMVFEKQQ